MLLLIRTVSGIQFPNLYSRLTPLPPQARHSDIGFEGTLSKLLHRMPFCSSIHLCSSWSFETQRYFGAEHLTIRKTRLVTLYPSKAED